MKTIISETEKKTRILFIEDNTFVIKAYDRFFQKAGFGVDVAENAYEAKKRLDERLPDIILMDLVMPGMNGFELLEKFQTEGITSLIPVIVVSNLGEQSDIDRCMELGAVEHLVKANYFMKDLIKKINHHLDTFVPLKLQAS